ncbi:unnamed protein product [Larinioides sclopetarius]|uniref:C2H2-type domain-containing protein n=1 Tax=Larinioides sclopetarius TaxID=280406 RepID=A0AAV2C0J5_9ARAC
MKMTLATGSTNSMHLFRCPHCTYSSNLKGNLKKHMLIHTGERQFECKFLNFSAGFVQQIAFPATNTKTSVYHCHLCAYASPHKSNLKTHMLVHTKERQFVCVHCKKAFTTKGNLKMHARIHSGERPYECSICDKKFTQKSSLLSHQFTHRDIV